MEYISSKAIAEKWGITVRAAQLMCVQGKIEGAKRLDEGKIWLIPHNAERPANNKLKKTKEKMKELNNELY